MDGNRRWARQHGLPELEGHAAGVEAIRALLRHAVRRGIPVMTLYAFSRENWARSDEEVTGLFGLLEAAIRNETAELRAQGVRVRLLGRIDELPDATRASIGEALDATAGGDRLLLNIAFNYAGRTELVDAFRRLVASGVPADEIDEAAISAALYTAGLPDPDLVIRTGGEQRLSNFLIWQSAYAEFYGARPSGRTSGRTSSTPRCSSSRAATAGSVADRPGPDEMRQRAISAAVLVPVLLVVLALGGVVLASGRRARHGRRRDRGLPPPQGRRVRVRSRARDRARAGDRPRCGGRPSCSTGAACSSVPIGIVLVAVASFTRPDPRDGLAVLDRHRLRGALRRAAVVHHPARRRGSRRPGRARRSAPSALSAAGSCS